MIKELVDVLAEESETTSKGKKKRKVPEEVVISDTDEEKEEELYIFPNQSAILVQSDFFNIEPRTIRKLWKKVNKSIFVSVDLPYLLGNHDWDKLENVGAFADEMEFLTAFADNFCESFSGSNGHAVIFGSPFQVAVLERIFRDEKAERYSFEMRNVTVFRKGIFYFSLLLPKTIRVCYIKWQQLQVGTNEFYRTIFTGCLG